MDLLRFDFSGYQRREVPEELTRIREVSTGISRYGMKFFALGHAHCECAKIIERADTGDFDEIYVANAEIADAITKAAAVSLPVREEIGMEKFLRLQQERLEAYKQSIRRAKDVDLQKFETRYSEDYDACSTICEVVPYYPEVMVKAVR